LNPKGKRLSRGKNLHLTLQWPTVLKETDERRFATGGSTERLWAERPAHHLSWTNMPTCLALSPLTKRMSPHHNKDRLKVRHWARPWVRLWVRSSVWTRVRVWVRH
jgi:hypothetical protein